MTNPANALAQILAAMIDHRGKVQIPGFYDDVVPLTDRERREMAALPFDEAAYFAEIGVSAAIGEEGYTALERRWARPTFDICGLTSGYQGAARRPFCPPRRGPSSASGWSRIRTRRRSAPSLRHVACRGLPAGHHLGNETITTARRASWFRWTAPTWRRRPARSSTPSAGRPSIPARAARFPSWAPSMTR